MGKGGCLFAFADMAVNSVRAVMGCLCCLACAGPILIIVGVIALIGPNNRASNVSQYNAAVANYNATAIALQSVNATVSNIAMQTTTQTINIIGNTDDVSSAGYSVILNAPSVAVNPSSSTNLPFSVAQPQVTPILSFSSTAPMAVSTKSTSVQCTSSSGCSSSKMQSLCDSASGCGGGQATLIGGPGCYGKCTLTCSWTQYVTSVCFQLPASVASTASGAVTFSTAASQTCTYPFNVQPTSCNSPSSYGSLPVNLRASTDPYITLQRVTDGTNNFGLTATEQRLLGLACIVIGGLFIAGLVGLCFCARGMFGDHRHKARVYEAFGRKYNYQQVDGGYYPPPQQQQYPGGPYPPQPYSTAPPPPGAYYNNAPQQQYPGAYGAPPPQQPYGQPLYQNQY